MRLLLKFAETLDAIRRVGLITHEEAERNSEYLTNRFEFWDRGLGHAPFDIRNALVRCEPGGLRERALSHWWVVSKPVALNRAPYRDRDVLVHIRKPRAEPILRQDLFLLTG